MTYSKECYKGRYQARNPQKYRGDLTEIVFRSSYELKFMRWCDTNENVLEWGSEEIIVPYRNPLDNENHRYFVDFYIKLKTKSNGIKKYLVEVKPYRFTQEPVIPKRKTQRFISEVKQWAVNQSKWKAARAYAKRMDADFMLVTEKDLGILG